MTANKKGLLPKMRKDDLVIKKLGAEVLVYDLKRDRALCLNETAALVWKQCDGRTTVGQAAERIGARFNTDVDENIILLALDRLGKERLLCDPAGPPVPRNGVSRRDLIRRLGVATAVALPLVTSIVAPTAAQTATCITNEVCAGRQQQSPGGCGTTPCCTGGHCRPVPGNAFHCACS